MSDFEFDVELWTLEILTFNVYAFGLLEVRSIQGSYRSFSF